MVHFQPQWLMTLERLSTHSAAALLHQNNTRFTAFCTTKDYFVLNVQKLAAIYTYHISTYLLQNPLVSLVFLMQWTHVIFPVCGN